MSTLWQWDSSKGKVIASLGVDGAVRVPPSHCQPAAINARMINLRGLLCEGPVVCKVAGRGRGSAIPSDGESLRGLVARAPLRLTSCMSLNSLLLVLLLLGGCASHSPAPSKPAVAEEYITALKETQKEFAKYKVPGLKSVKDCTQDKCPADKGIWMNQDDFDKWDDAIDDLLHGKETYEHVLLLKDRKINQMVDGWSQTDIALKKAEAEAKKLEEQREHEERWRFVKDSFYNILIGTMSIINYIK